MIVSLDASQVVEGLTEVALKWKAAKAQLNALDGATGDGDLGITMSRGSQAILDGLIDPGEDVGQVLRKAGLDFNEAAPSTMGALLATGFIAMARETSELAEIDSRDAVRMVAAADCAIRARGGAATGDKTMLDALVPARMAIEEAVERGLTLRQAFEAGLAAAEAGVQATADMKPSAGRARWLGERTLGHEDAGATVVYLALEATVHFLDALDEGTG